MASLNVMASNRPDRVIQSLPRWSYFDRTILFVHEKDLSAFEAAFQETGASMPEIHTHNIPARSDGQPPMGKIRHYAMEMARREMNVRDWAVLTDDDLIKAPRLAHSKQMKTGGYSFRTCDAQTMYAQLETVAKEARGSFAYFTHSFNAMRKNGYKPERPLRAVWHWSGLFGFFKNSPNPFNPQDGLGADDMAAAHAVISTGTLPVLQNDSLVLDWLFVVSKPARNENFKSFVKTTAGVFELSNKNRSGAVRLHLNRKHLMHLKRTVEKDYR